jgi:ABC-type multidrug transport system fused ATPase/permease subunit
VPDERSSTGARRTTNADARVADLRHRRDNLRRDLASARRTLRTREHEAERAGNVSKRFDNWMKVGWSFLNLGVFGLVGGVVTVFLNALTPLSLSGGPIVACFVTGGLLLIAAIIYLVNAHIYDTDYQRVNDGKATRREYFEYKQHVAAEQLDNVTELFTTLQEVEAELIEAQAQASTS